MHSFMMKNLIPLPPASLLLTELHLHHISRGTKVRLHATNFFTFFFHFFFLYLRLVTSKTDKVKISIKPGAACATE